jgi:hypothetical protein
MNRRSTLKYLVAGGVITSIGGSYLWLTKEREHPHLTIETVLNRLDTLDLNYLSTSGSWDATRTFHHLAQSVEFSMDGYPAMKPKLFQNTIGKLAFSVFHANGSMTHGLDEAIPGEIVVNDNSDVLLARQRLIDSLKSFDAFEQNFQPHFAYGELSKSQYALAHVMHVNNHMQEFQNA